MKSEIRGQRESDTEPARDKHRERDTEDHRDGETGGCKETEIMAEIEEQRAEERERNTRRQHADEIT